MATLVQHLVGFRCRNSLKQITTTSRFCFLLIKTHCALVCPFSDIYTKQRKSGQIDLMLGIPLPNRVNSNEPKSYPQHDQSLRKRSKTLFPAITIILVSSAPSESQWSNRAAWPSNHKISFQFCPCAANPCVRFSSDMYAKVHKSRHAHTCFFAFFSSIRNLSTKKHGCQRMTAACGNIRNLETCTRISPHVPAACRKCGLVCTWTENSTCCNHNIRTRQHQ